MSKKLNKIIDWLTKLGFEFKISNTDFVNYTDKIVCINGVQSNKNKVFSLLHECGHILLFNKSSYNEDYKVLYKSRFDGRVSKSNLFRYKKLREEIEAWENGYLLAKKLDIKINKDEYDVYASKCFKTYIKFYA